MSAKHASVGAILGASGVTGIFALLANTAETCAKLLEIFK